MKVKINLMECKHCGHKWLPRKAEIRQCPNPKCRTAWFDKEKVKKTLAILVCLLCLGCRPAFAEIQIDINIIAQIESNYNPVAYNKKSQARGLCQITPIVLREFNIMVRKKGYIYTDMDAEPERPEFLKIGSRTNFKKDASVTLKNLFNNSINKAIANWYINERIPQMLKHYKIPDTMNNRLWVYNAGILKVKKGIKPEETINYIKKYHHLQKES